jgi:hypothetical protein
MSKLLVLLLSTLTLTCFGANSNLTPDLLTEFDKEFLARDSIKTQTNHIDVSSEEFLLRAKLLKAEYQYDISNYAHRRSVFDWQLFSSKVIFWMVNMVVIVGILFAAVQFYVSMKPNSLNGNADRAQMEFEASTTGFKIKSSILGVIILAMSITFYYLFLAYAYDVKELGTQPGKSIPVVPTEK